MQYDQTVPDYLRANAPAPELTAGIAQARGPHITIRNGQFLKVDTAGVEVNCTQFHSQLGPYVDIVVVAGSAGLAKVFYETAYDPNSPDFPTCFSNDGKFPDAGSTAVQAPSCAQCPQNVFGSLITPTGGRAKACSDRKRLAVLLLTEFTADMRSGPIYEFSVSPSNLRAWNEFVTTLIGRGVPPDGIVVRISPDPGKQGGMLFNAAVDPGTNSGVWFIPKWAYDLSQVAKQSEEAKRAIGFYATPAQPALNAPPAQPALPVPTGTGNPLPVQPTTYAGPNQFGTGYPTFAPAAPVPAAAPSGPAFAPQPGLQQAGVATGAFPSAGVTNQPAQRRPRRTKAEMEAARAAQVQSPTNQEPNGFGAAPAPSAATPFAPTATPSTGNPFGSSPQGGFATAADPGPIPAHLDRRNEGGNGQNPPFGVHTAATAPAVDPELDKMLGDVMGRPAH